MAGDVPSLPAQWAAWEQGGREFWQQMDELVVMLDGLVEPDETGQP